MLVGSMARAECSSGSSCSSSTWKQNMDFELEFSESMIREMSLEVISLVKFAFLLQYLLP